LRRRKRRATTREDLEISPVAVLFGRGLLDATQYDTPGQVAEWLRRLAHNLGPRSDSVGGLWAALTGAAISAQGSVPVAVGPAANHARYVLGRMLRRLDGSRDLVLQLAEDMIPPLVVHALEDRLTAADHGDLALSRRSLDRVAGTALNLLEPC
jgi:hypothetical protein